MARIALAVRADDATDDPSQTYATVLHEVVPSGLTSMIFHIVMLLVLALWWLPQPQPESAAALSVKPNEPELDDTELVLPTPERHPDPDPTDSVPDPNPPPEPPPVPLKRGEGIIECPVPGPGTPAPNLPGPSTVMYLPIDCSPGIGVPTKGTNTFAWRDPKGRPKALKEVGWNPQSSTAVEAALRWLAAHQNSDGSWSYDHREGGRCNCRNPGEDHGKFGSTALALLAFLGAGETHETGRYKKTVDRGLGYLLATMDANEDRSIAKMLDTGHAGMYAHGLATMALAEAYGMTHDTRLRAPAQASLNWIIESQAPGGFWGYTGGGNDTSVSGWQVMALKSGYAAGLNVPDKTIVGIRRGLDSVASRDGAFYGYRKPESSFRPATTAIGLLGRIYTGWPNDHTALRRGMSEILAKGPDLGDMYYTYYATQAMYQYTSGKGAAWHRFNVAMRDRLIATQSRTGHEGGSWKHGRFNDRGGRIYSTALAAMCLEIYYRYEPVYQKSRTFGTVKSKRGFAGAKPEIGADEAGAWDLE